MPKNLQVYYNYVYKYKKISSKFTPKVICFFLIFILLIIFNNNGLLSRITQKTFEIFKEQIYYALVLNENESKFSVEELKQFGCATNEYLNNIILNIYINENTCKKAYNNLTQSNLACNVKKINLNSITIKNNIALNLKNKLKESVLICNNTVKNLINYCEEFDTQKTTFLTIKQNCNNLLNSLNTQKQMLVNLKNISISNKIILLLTDISNILNNIIYIDIENKSSYLKEQTIYSLIKFINIMY